MYRAIQSMPVNFTEISVQKEIATFIIQYAGKPQLFPFQK